MKSSATSEKIGGAAKFPEISFETVTQDQT